MPAAPEAPVLPRLAVSVIMLRRDADDPVVFIQNRAHTMDFAAGMVVFPGGRVDGKDYVTARKPELSRVAERHASAWQKSAISDGGARSTREMSAILLAAALREVEEETGASLTAGELTPWANWVTPSGMPKRFDTYFYLTQPAPSLDPRHQTTEASSSHWSSVRSILTEADDGALQLMPPTRHLLEELVGLDPDDKQFRSGRPIEPVWAMLPGRPVL
ncbi:NUDIX hydrolase [Arthrobacter roseus]|uniref:NUDIX hydrolase n=1 Tax=Arthrobacter roseus TaxID=136274 RepID=UPI001962F6F4|nr:NUDIX domain-containing protein [Arthrobacter roseus]MBM7846921.1 8-oxo-dGTP pyrophosphatase MutT (NUDIX family) [Arthrobacter roseus]